MSKFNYRIERYNDCLKIDIRDDVLFSKLKTDIFELLGSNIEDEVMKKGTSIFLAKSTNGLIIRYPGKKILLTAENRNLFIDLDASGYRFKDGDEEFLSTELTNEGKHYLFDRIIDFMSAFKECKKYLPVDSSFNILFSCMGILNFDDVTIVGEDAGVILFLNPFRELNLSKLKLNIADGYTYEVVGTMELSLNKKEVSNFSYSGNVTYDIYEEKTNKGYATSALKALISYVGTVSDEYNKVLCIAALAEDIPYQKVALNNGAVLEYDGKVPEGDSLASLNKINEIKIYRIGDKQYTN